MSRGVRPFLVLPLVTLLLWVAAIPLAPAKTAVVPMRGGEHENFSRIVFDFTRVPGYRSETGDARVVLHFDEPFDFDAGGIDPASLRSLEGIDTAGDGRSVTFRLAPNVRPEILVVEGRKLVVDLVRHAEGKSPPALALASPVPPPTGRTKHDAKREGKKMPGQKATAHETAEDIDPRDRAALAGLAKWAQQEKTRAARLRERKALQAGERIIAGLARGPDAAEDGQDEAQGMQEGAEGAGDAGDTEAATPSGPTAGDATEAAAHNAPHPSPSTEEDAQAQLATSIDRIRPATGSNLVVTTIEDAEGFALVFDLPEQMPAAIFRRAGVLWVVFARPMEVDQSAVKIAAGTPGADRITGISALRIPNATALRYRLRTGFDIAVAERGRRWFVYLKSGIAVPRRLLDPHVETGENGPRVFIPVDDPGPRIDLTDPDIGDTISVVPVPGNAVGLMRERRFPQFTLLKSGQGVVVVPLDERIEVRRYTNGVAIQTDGGLEISQGLLGRAMSDGAAGPRRLVDLAAWRGGGPEDFRDREDDLLIRLSLAGPADRSAARWDLARMYLGYGMGPEGLAELTLLAEQQPAIADTPEYHAARGIAAFLLNRPKEAMRALNDPQLDAESEVWLWRTRVYEQLGWHAVAVQAYLQGREALVEQDPEFAIAVRLAAARAMIETSAFEKAKAELDDLEVLALDGKPAIETAWLEGRLAEATGDRASARAHYRDVAESQDRRLSVMARLALVEDGLASGDMSVGEAIKELERLHYAWRGDALELKVLDRLGDLYVKAGRYRAGLESWENATAAFRDSPQARRIAAKMAKVFRRLFLEGEADKLPAIKALGLFYDFRELTPLGADGDRMIRHLVDRMVELELYDRAAELLEHQVRFRLEGAAQSSVAVPLAKIYLLAGKPQKAIDILRATRQQLLAADVISARRRVEARALAELGRYEEAAAIIEREQGREAELLRIDFYWGAKDWQNLVRSARRLLAMRNPPDAPLAPDEQRVLVRMALALSFLDDHKALAELRQRYGNLMREGTLAGLFDLLTSPEPPDLETLDRISSQMARIVAFGSYLDHYRDEFVRGAHSSTIGKPAATDKKDSGRHSAPADTARVNVTGRSPAETTTTTPSSAGKAEAEHPSTPAAGS